MLRIFYLTYFRRKNGLQQVPQNRHYNIYSETPPNRKLVRSQIFNTQLTDGNANVVPTQSQVSSRKTERQQNKQKSARNKLGKNSYDRIKIGNIRWRLPSKENQNYADINGLITTSNTEGPRDKDTKKIFIPQPPNNNYENSPNNNCQNPDMFVLQSCENISRPKHLKKNCSVSPEETVMEENSEVYESIETNA